MTYSLLSAPFGQLLAASRADRLCYLAFADTSEKGLDDVRSRFPGETLQAVSSQTHQWVLDAFLHRKTVEPSRLDLQGTPFQLRVWKAVHEIPFGHIRTYQELALAVNHPKATRAVGTAIGRNPIALIIPCHRVVRSDGALGGYHWGLANKQALLDWESAG